VTTPHPFRLTRFGLICLLGITVFVTGCGRRRTIRETAYVSATQANLRDRIAAVYTKVGLVKNGEQVEILDRDRRFAKVRTASGAEGWIEQRNLVGQDVYNKAQNLAQTNQTSPVQAQATTRNDTNLHVEPGRDADHLYQVPTGAKVQLLKRAVAEKPGVTPPPARPAAQSDEKKEVKPMMEDWWLARDDQGHVGWILARMVDLDLPLEIAQYAEGQRIVAYFVLDEVRDGDKKVPQYLTLLTEPKDGLPFDFNQIRVFTWNVKRHRYETAYRERLQGVLPVIVGQENFEKEGTLPTFTVRVQDEGGTVTERKYKLNTPIVRRVLAPGEEVGKKHRQVSH